MVTIIIKYYKLGNKRYLRGLKQESKIKDICIKCYNEMKGGLK